MIQTPVYLDNHATTRVDPRVVEAMLPHFDRLYGNAGSVSHQFGHEARAAVDDARSKIAAALGASEREIIFTSGATESNNLAIRGLAERPRRRGNHIVSVTTEHKSVLDPLRRLLRRGFEVILLPVHSAGSPSAGRLDPQLVKESLRDDTLLVTVMLANNEIGVIQPLAEIARICHEREVPVHCDATQAVGKIPLNVGQLDVDFISFTAHKIYGPKGVGALFARRGGARLRLEPQIDGGGQEAALRSGTLNVPGIVGFARALELCIDEMDEEARRLANLRQRLWDRLRSEVCDVERNGPDWDQMGLRLPGNLNATFPGVEGEALMISMHDVAVSSGSACTSANPEPSHVLRALGLNDDQVRASLRFGIGRFNTAEEIDYAVHQVSDAVHKLRKLGGQQAGG